MTTDLYSTDLSTISGSDLYQAISQFLRTSEPLNDRPREGYLLDFKEALSDRFMHSVAAFANTFGGVLILGVTESDGRPDKIVGLTARGELKTQVASTIASNLFPSPPFDIAECSIPGDAEKRLCVVRIRETREICLLAKKGEKNPVYIRIEDQSAPADASQMRSLLNRKRQNEDLVEDLGRRGASLRTPLFVCSYSQNQAGIRTNTFFKIALYPYNHTTMPLDLSVERALGAAISQQNPGLDRLSKMGQAQVDFHRSRDWTEIRSREYEHDYERRWRLTNHGDIGFVTQVKWPITESTGTKNVWSLYDVVADLVRVGTLAKELWRSTSYYGGFRLETNLNVDGLGNIPEFRPLFYARLGNISAFPLDTSGIILRESLAPPVMEVAEAELDLDYTSFNESFPSTVSILVNQLLRGLGHLADLKGLERSIHSAFFPLNPPPSLL